MECESVRRGVVQRCTKRMVLYEVKQFYPECVFSSGRQSLNGHTCKGETHSKSNQFLESSTSPGVEHDSSEVKTGPPWPSQQLSKKEATENRSLKFFKTRSTKRSAQSVAPST